MNNENINDIMTKLFEFNNELENTDLTSDSTVSNLSVNDLISLLNSFGTFWLMLKYGIFKSKA